MASGDKFPDYQLENPCGVIETYLLIDTTPDGEKATIEVVSLGVLDHHEADEAVHKYQDKYQGKYKMVLETRQIWLDDRRYYVAALKVRAWCTFFGPAGEGE